MEMHAARLREPFSHGVSDPDELGYRSLSRDAFPRGGGPGGFGSARRFEHDVELEVELDSGPEAAAEARTAVTALDGRADPQVLEDVRLLVSEVVTNSVRHADMPRGASVALRLAAAADTVRVEVTDAGRGFEPRPRRASSMEAGGWGLHLVDRIATRWGVDRRDGSRVWFEIRTG